MRRGQRGWLPRLLLRSRRGWRFIPNYSFQFQALFVRRFARYGVPARMPIYEFACPKCRRIFSFLSKRVKPDRPPVCPKCGHKKLSKQVSRFAMVKGLADSAVRPGVPDDGPPMPDLDDPRIERAMSELERDMDHLDENNPRHMAHIMKKMKDVMPAGTVPKELDVAIKRLEAGEDPEKIEADMGDVLGECMGGPDDESGGMGGGGGYTRDGGLYDY
jgi:putative FmdB family regulatory protein